MTETVTVTDKYVVQKGESLSFDSSPAFIMDSPKFGVAPSLINNGSVSVTATAPHAAIEQTQDNSGCSILNAAGAVFSVHNAPGSSAGGFYFNVAGNRFTNEGTFTVESTGSARGGFDWGGLTFDNSGTFRVAGDTSAEGLNMNGSFDNSGLFSVSSDQGQAIGIDFTIFHGVVHNEGRMFVSGVGTVIGVRFAKTATFENSGRLIVTQQGFGDGIGVEMGNTAVASFVNSGLLKADVAILEDGLTGHPIVVDNTGKIIGDCIFAKEDDSILNHGQMKGLIDLGAGDDSYDGAHGVLKGAVLGGDGDDLLVGGKTGESLSGDDGLGGEDGADTIQGGGGDDTLAGGLGADQLSGGAGDDVFVYRSVADSNVKGMDLIKGLSDADKIDLSGIDADTGHGGDQAFTLVEALSGHAGQAALIYDADARVTHLLLDVDGDGKAEASIAIQGDHTDFTSFVL